MKYEEMLKSIEYQIEEYVKNVLNIGVYAPKIEIDLLQVVKKSVYKERE